MTFCNEPHPIMADVFCRRLRGHTRDHSAFTGSIVRPEIWEDERVAFDRLKVDLVIEEYEGEFLFG